MYLNDLCSELQPLSKDLEEYAIEGKRDFIILKQTDIAYAEILAQAFATNIKIRVEVLHFKKGEDFRQWLNQQKANKKNGYSIGETLLDLKVNSEYSVLEIVKRLDGDGFTRVTRVQEPREFSLLGDVLQVYLSGYKEILRLSFFGNILEQISFIDVENKKSIHEVKQFVIFKTDAEIQFQNENQNLKNVKQSSQEIKQFIGNPFAKELFSIKLIMIEDGLPGYDLKKFDAGIVNIPGGKYVVGEIEAIKRIINQYQAKNFKVEFLLNNNSFPSYKELTKFVESNNTIYKDSLIKISLLDNQADADILPPKGFEITRAKTVYFTQYELEAEINLNNGKQNQLISSGTIRKGDYVVHADHGIAIFDGIVVQDEKSYLLLQYAGNDKLYVPFDQVERVSKYLGSRKGMPTLTKLNGGTWNRATTSVRKDLAQIAKELLQLYYLRKNTSAVAIMKEDSEISDLAKFVDEFEFKDTQDQIASTQEILNDLSRGFPMDRLVVGDVGFGKTEVAMRAAFAVVNAGKQVAVLAPTTVLVEQHRGVFQHRFKNFPEIRIASISRFQSQAEQRQIINDLELGLIDILIGTHSILSPRVKFNNLGLIVVDEEQRFGVKHKEKLKLKRLDSHVLTLSATPIPRTLNMSLSGVRDISIIETPPTNRKPIQNYFGKHDWNIIESAIIKEKERNGQVYFLHNRVRDIESIALKINERLPQLRVDVVHGQMAVHHLAKVMREFAEGIIDVLVCTTIIENGIDLPNANTLIVDDVEKLGLAQIYQIRGRIGRSEREAFAYMFYESLRGNSSLRVEAMAEFQELGVGYKLANRDLEIRGSGAILGDSQSGFIDSVGYSLYMQMLNEEILSGMNKSLGSKGVENPKKLVRIKNGVSIDEDSAVKQNWNHVEQIWLR